MLCSLLGILPSQRRALTIHRVSEVVACEELGTSAASMIPFIHCELVCTV